MPPTTFASHLRQQVAGEEPASLEQFIPDWAKSSECRQAYIDLSKRLVGLYHEGCSQVVLILVTPEGDPNHQIQEALGSEWLWYPRISLPALVDPNPRYKERYALAYVRDALESIPVGFALAGDSMYPSILGIRLRDHQELEF
jgi:hypothetical protein